MNGRLGGPVLAAFLVASVASCAPRHGDTTVLRLVATTTVIGDLASRVAGDRVRVAALVPPGVPVEDFVPTPSDAIAIARASVILVNGRGLDRWIAPLLADAAAGVTVVTLTEGLPNAPGGVENPHSFLDVAHAITYVERIRDALVAVDPAGAAAYRASAAAYAIELRALDAEIRATVATVPEARRVLVTSHDAFPFFAAAYGFTVVGFVQGESGKEPSPSELAALVERVRRANVPAVFAERALSPRLATTLAREAGVATVVTDLLTDGVGAPPVDTYVALMRFNVDRIAAALR